MTAAWPTASVVGERAVSVDREPLEIAHHGGRCCVLARTWLEGLDATFNGGPARIAPPAWIGQRFTADAANPAVHWCDIPAADALHPAAAVALGRELWGLRCKGIRGVQIAAGSGYIEAIGRETDGCLEIWDGLAWLRPAPGGPACLLRVLGTGAPLLRWGDHLLTSGVWTSVE